jgi:hypothetical protein
VLEEPLVELQPFLLEGEDVVLFLEGVAGQGFFVTLAYSCT